CLHLWDVGHGNPVTPLPQEYPQFSPAGANRARNNAAMIIGDRLRALREEKKFSHGDIEKRQAFCAATSPASKTGIPCRPSRRSRKWSAPSRSLSTSSSTTGKSHPNCPISPSARPRTRLSLAARGRQRVF